MNPLRKIKITPLAAESLGVRSMCTFVETPDMKILMDPGVSLCPYRFSLLPHPIEFKTIKQLRKKIAEFAQKAEFLSISHYHFDHYTPNHQDYLVNWTEDNKTAQEIFQNKNILIKHPTKKINYNQRLRAFIFKKTSIKNSKKIEPVDGISFQIGKATTLSFSKPVPHGPEDAKLGWTIMTSISYENECFMFSPDVQGPISEQTKDEILKMSPSVLMIGGPPFYLEGTKIRSENIIHGLKNLCDIVEKIPLTIIEHHTLRDANWRYRSKKAFTAATKLKHKILCAAEFLGVKEKLLESKREELYAKTPPSREFEKWANTPTNSIHKIKPPV